jgi:4-amino-4-deoxy-L-arabinose transferase-like glycosyltransferase
MTAINRPICWVRDALSDRPKWIVATLLVIHGGLLAWGAAIHSPNLMEYRNLPTGMYHLETGRFDLGIVNPPLVRTIAALPAWWGSEPVDWSRLLISSAGASRETQAAELFMEANGDRAFRFFTFGRWMCIPFSLLGGWICWRLARELYGSVAGVSAAALWCLCPNLLGNGMTISTDVAAAALGVAALYAAWIALRRPTWAALILAGIVLGLAQLTKTTLLLLFPVLLGMCAAFRFRDAAPESWSRLARHAFALLATALLTINVGYGFEGTGRALGSYQFVSRALAGRLDAGESAGNRFRGTLLENVPIPLPYWYVAGIDWQEMDLENRDHQRHSYLRGTWSDSGWWYYYLYGLAVKVPLGVWLLAAISLELRLSSVDDRTVGVERRILEAAVCALFVFIIAVTSAHTGFSMHFRYVLPAFPLLFVWISQAATVCVPPAMRDPTASSPMPKCDCGFVRLGWLAGLFVAAHAWIAVSSLAAYPNSLAYFNEAAGGPENGHKHLLHSSVDWGQDLFLLRDWIREHPEAAPIHLAVTGPCAAQIFADVAEIGRVRWLLADPDWRVPKPGWYALSINVLHPQDGKPSGFVQMAPVARVGYTIRIYHITVADVR